MELAFALPAVSLLNRIRMDLKDILKGDRELEAELDTALRDVDGKLKLQRHSMNMAMPQSNEGHGEQQDSILKLQELVYEMEDFTAERRRSGKTSAPVRFLKGAAFQTDRRPDHIKCVEGFLKQIKEITDAKAPSPADVAAAAAAAAAAAVAAAAASPLVETTACGSCGVGSAPPQDKNTVGMQEPKKEIIELLLPAAGDERKVIAILGCVGAGKTTLAKALWYDPSVQARFPTLSAWVPAPQSPDNVPSVLKSLLQHFRQHDNQERENEEPCHGAQEAPNAVLMKFLKNKRYLVIVDGVQQREVLDTILSALPKNKEGSRVVVTTSICSVARAFSSGRYLYTMRGLDNEEAEDLFWKTTNLNRSPAAKEGLKTLFDKCEGLPLVVVGASKFLGGVVADLNAEHYREVGTALGTHLAGRDGDVGDQSFKDARTALARHWHSLHHRYEQKMCTFSLSSFPKGDDGCGIKTKSLLRRWVAEGLVAQEKDARIHWDKLLDLCVLEPVSVSRMGRNIKRCQVHGVTLEYLVHRSLSWNFIALVQEGIVERGEVPSFYSIRRVAIHGGDEDDIIRVVEGHDLRSVRSLTVRKKKTIVLVPASLLEKCKMLRVLDLEGCSWSGIGSESDNHVRLICELLHLRYLSLRGTEVAQIPRAISQLHSLDTLDVRDTKVDKLPMEVLMLPQLAHLFGRFELPAQLEEEDPKGKLKYFFSRKSKLVTLAGFMVIVNSRRRGHELILRHTRTLKKVKVWCVRSPADHPAATIPPPRGVFSALRFRRRMCRDVNVDVPRPRNYNRVGAVSQSSSPPVGDDDTPSIILRGLVTSLDDPNEEKKSTSRLIGSNVLDSLSVDFHGCHYGQFLDSVLQETCCVRSIKVRGRQEGLPDSEVLMKLNQISELHLCNTGLGTNKLSGLQSMPCLEYLKLEDDSHEDFGEGSFVVNKGGFPSLLRLCFHGRRLPAVSFTEGSMERLLSLQLICPSPAGKELGVEGVEHLPSLDEVILHPNASPDKMDAWTEATRNHTRRPNVKKQH